MTTKTVKVEIPFQRLLNVIDQLTTDEKLVLKKRLEKEKVTTWQERFGKALQYLGKKNKGFSASNSGDTILIFSSSFNIKLNMTPQNSKPASELSKVSHEYIPLPWKKLLNISGGN